MPVALTSDALTTLASVKEELGLSGDSLNDSLSRLINAVSRRIRSHCRRQFSYDASIAEYVAGMGGTILTLKRRPIISVASVTYDGATISSDDYSINSDQGQLYAPAGWYWTAKLLQNARYDALPGSEEKTYLVTYAAGYVTPAQSSTAEISAVADAGGGSVTITSAGHGLSSGVTVRHTNFDDDNYNGDFEISNVTTNTYDIEATWGATDTGRWEYPIRTLPEDLEDACLIAVASRYQAKGQDARIKSEKSLNYAVTYADNASLLPPAVKEMLAPYRELL